MPYPAHGTRRALGIALLWCALLIGAAETGGAIAPPCAAASPAILPSSSGTMPVGDPDTPDEGTHKNSATTTVGLSHGSMGLILSRPAPSRARFDWLEWLRALLGFHH